LLVKPIASTLPWRGLLAASGAALLVSSLPGSATLQTRLGAIALSLGAAFLLDDPAEVTLQSTPAPRLLRRSLRVALASPLLAASWALLLWRTGARDLGGRTLELGGPLSATLAVAAALGGIAASPVPLAFFVADRLLPAGCRLFGDTSPDRRWLVLPALAALVGICASLDPGRRRPFAASGPRIAGPRRHRPVQSLDDSKEASMPRVRRGARAVLKYLIPFYVLAVVVQVFLAGEGIFGAKGSPTDEDASTTLNAHRDFGYLIAEPGAILLLVVALLAWLPDKRTRWLTIALPFVIWIQLPLTLSRWSGAFHPLNAFVILGLLLYLTRALWGTAPRSVRREESGPTAG
jgi:hypothetical protein